MWCGAWENDECMHWHMALGTHVLVSVYYWTAHLEHGYRAATRSLTLALYIERNCFHFVLYLFLSAHQRTRCLNKPHKWWFIPMPFQPRFATIYLPLLRQYLLNQTHAHRTNRFNWSTPRINNTNSTELKFRMNSMTVSILIRFSHSINFHENEQQSVGCLQPTSSIWTKNTSARTPHTFTSQYL